ncbi:MAG TPA: sel1 repeat family protein [Rhodobacterales bacterium]|nr:sel1 repeat family protein [Rhodobacterales bacterium]
MRQANGGLNMNRGVLFLTAALIWPLGAGAQEVVVVGSKPALVGLGPVLKAVSPNAPVARIDLAKPGVPAPKPAPELAPEAAPEPAADPTPAIAFQPVPEPAAPAAQPDATPPAEAIPEAQAVASQDATEAGATVPGDQAPVAEEPVAEEAVSAEAVAGDAEAVAGDAEQGVAELGDAPVNPEPMPEPEPDPSPDPVIAACLSTGPTVTARVPTGKAEAAARRAALIAAIKPCIKAAALDDAPAEVLFLASEIAQGKRDVATAYALLERAAAKGLAAAETRLGDYHLFGVAPGGEDVEKAIAHFKAAAEMGDPAGMTTLALMHRVGKGVPRDPARMVALLQKAADAGYHFAQYRLAQTYLNGDGIAGRRDDSLGIPDTAKAVELYKAAAQAGNITAALELAALYGDPNSGVPQDPVEQARLTLMASRAGQLEATAAMGVLYETGQGVARNPEVAALLYVKALESGKVGFDDLRKTGPRGWDYDTAVAFQKILQDRGLYDGALDGVIGPGSRAGALALAGVGE